MDLANIFSQIQNKYEIYPLLSPLKNTPKIVSRKTSSVSNTNMKLFVSSEDEGSEDLDLDIHKVMSFLHRY